MMCGRSAALDDIDRAILAELAADGRLPNNALAERVGVAPSTCLTRTRALRECGAIRGFHAEVDPAALGLPLQALVSVRLTAHERAAVDAFRARSVRLPGVVSVFHVAGAEDYVLHVRAASRTRCATSCWTTWRWTRRCSTPRRA